MKIDSFVLDNGLKVFLCDFKDSSKVVNISIFYKVGSSYEVLGASGIAHLLEHLSFKSTTKHKAGEFDEIIKNLGGTNNACTSFDYTQYYVNIASQNCEKVLELFANMMDGLAFLDEEFFSELKVVQEEERLRVQNNAFGYIYNALYAFGFCKNSYHWTPIGFADDIANLTPIKVREFYDKFYSPNNACIVLSGDLDGVDAKNIISKHFAKKFKKTINFKDAIEPDYEGKKEIILHFNQPTSDILARGIKIPNFKHEDAKYLKALALFFNLERNSPIQNEIIHKCELANQIDFMAQLGRSENLFAIFAVANQGINASEISAKMNEIFKEFSFTAEHLEIIQNQFELNLNQIKAAPTALASGVGKYFCFGDEMEFINSLQGYNLDLNKLNKVYKKYFANENYTQIILKEKK